MATAFLRQRATASSHGVRIIKDLLTRKTFLNPNFSPQAFTTTQLYRLAIKEPVPKNFVAYPLAPVEVPKVRGPKPPQAATPSEAFPPHPEHPIRSIRFLKTVILSQLEAARFIKLYRKPRVTAVQEEVIIKGKKQKIPQKSSKADFVWKVAGPRPPKPTVIKRHKNTRGWDVGVGLDISHLNKRRQRARVLKVRSDVEIMKALRQPPPIVTSTSTTARAP
ncbi:hypothetical protein D9619_010724 [Psilocybe cf. subviscida]|uniref:Uncharacterized protein n=1 Tax=Psilocybe cf. subviscida TaxID=2480587 RepID=A0A8H5B924_9AGAR|nr:hypothetical protein D9619_010724 [Psilocybe cf. subviscida]